jgi:hypothetical protein
MSDAKHTPTLENERDELLARLAEVTHDRDRLVAHLRALRDDESATLTPNESRERDCTRGALAAECSNALHQLTVMRLAQAGKADSETELFISAACDNLRAALDQPAP